METSKSVVYALFDAKAAVDFPSMGGQTALMLAAHHGLVELARVLLECAASAEMSDAHGCNSLMLAADGLDEHTVQLLLMEDQASHLAAATSNEVCEV